MIGVENITDWLGQDVIDSVGEKLGKLEHVYFDGETDVPTFIAVKSGTFSKSLTLVPLAEASVGRDYVRVSRSKGEVKKAPSYDTDVELTLDDEAGTFTALRARLHARRRGRAPARQALGPRSASPAPCGEGLEIASRIS